MAVRCADAPDCNERIAVTLAVRSLRLAKSNWPSLRSDCADITAPSSDL
jgi:hypothetical protein